MATEEEKERLRNSDGSTSLAPNGLRGCQYTGLFGHGVEDPELCTFNLNGHGINLL